MSLQGSIEGSGLADVLQLLERGKKAGTLTVSSGDREVRFELSSGRLTAIRLARFDAAYDLGRKLVARGALEEEQLNAAAEHRGSRELGAYLVESEITAAEAVRSALDQQRWEVALDTFLLRHGQYAWTEGTPATGVGPHPNPLPISTLLMEASNVAQRWPIARQRQPRGCSQLFRVAEASGTGNADLFSIDDESPAEEALLKHASGQSVAHVLASCGIDGYRARIALHDLLEAGRLRAEPDERVPQAERLITGGVATEVEADGWEALGEAMTSVPAVEPDNVTLDADLNLGRVLHSSPVGCVYEAVDRSGRVVRATQLALTDDADPSVVRRALGRILRDLERVEHRSIVPTLRYGTLGDRWYLVGEVAGGTLLAEAILGEAPWRAVDYGALLVQGATALHHLHHRGFVHGSLSPYSIARRRIGDGNPEFVIADAAEALIVGSSELAPLLADGREAPWRWSPPERFLGESATPSDDVYALSTLVFQMATARHPFPGENWAEVSAAQSAGEPFLDPRIGYGRKLPVWLKSMAEAALCDRENRAPTFQHLMAAVRKTGNEAQSA